MSKLVLDDNNEESELWDRHMLAGTHDGVSICDATYVLHSSIFVVWAHDVVDLGEWVSLTKDVLVKSKGGLSDSKNHFFSQVLNQRLSNVDSLWWVLWVEVLIESVWTSTDSIEIRRNSWGLLELIGNDSLVFLVEVKEPLTRELLDNLLSLFSSVFMSGFLAIRNDVPVRWGGTGQGHFSFKGWLVKAWEYSVAMESLELSVQILVFVN
jgi:hypothetical protein